MSKSLQDTKASTCFVELGSSLKGKGSFNDPTGGEATSQFYQNYTLETQRGQKSMRMQAHLAVCELVQLHENLIFVYPTCKLLFIIVKRSV